MRSGWVALITGVAIVAMAVGCRQAVRRTVPVAVFGDVQDLPQPASEPAPASAPTGAAPVLTERGTLAVFELQGGAAGDGAFIAEALRRGLVARVDEMTVALDRDCGEEAGRDPCFSVLPTAETPTHPVMETPPSLLGPWPEAGAEALAALEAKGIEHAVFGILRGDTTSTIIADIWIVHVASREIRGSRTVEVGTIDALTDAVVGAFVPPVREPEPRAEAPRLVRRQVVGVREREITVYERFVRFSLQADAALQMYPSGFVADTRLYIGFSFVAGKLTHRLGLGGGFYSPIANACESEPLTGGGVSGRYSLTFDLSPYYYIGGEASLGVHVNEMTECAPPGGFERSPSQFEILAGGLRMGFIFGRFRLGAVVRIGVGPSEADASLNINAGTQLSFDI